MMTSRTIAKLIIVKMLFKMLDSLTPAESSSDSNMTMKNEKKSGYLAKKSMFIGSNSWKNIDIRFPNKLSK